MRSTRGTRARRAAWTVTCALLAATATTASACGSAPQHALSALGREQDVQTVPAGVSFRAHLDAPLSSVDAREGLRFSATIDEPLLASDGSTVVERGARLRGHVVDVAHGDGDRLVVQFDAVEIQNHFRPIHAQVLRIEAGRVVANDPENRDSAAASIYPPLGALRPAGAVGGGPPAPSSVELPAGALIDLYLARPLSAALARP